MQTSFDQAVDKQEAKTDSKSEEKVTLDTLDQTPHVTKQSK